MLKRRKTMTVLFIVLLNFTLYNVLIVFMNDGFEV
jgi:hypothetical protein